MTCGETREYLFAFLDSELDAPLSIELQRHLDGCAHCAREAEIERTVRKQITSVMVTAPAEIPALDDMVGSMFTHDAAPIERIRPAHPIRIFHWGRLLAAAALALAVGASLWLALKDRPADSGVASLTDLVVADFEHFLEKGQPVQIESTDSDAVSVWLRERTAVAVVLPSALDPRCKLIGGRKCKIAGQPAAFAVYDMKGVPASLVAVAAQHGDLQGMAEVHHNGATHWVDHSKGYTVVACRRAELLYAAVGQLPQEELFCLMSGAVHEGD
ncbi:MAG: zf-HC2 domain-containing protein [Planctomycetota bacterium]|jgi:anti-sigma factor RsiW